MPSGSKVGRLIRWRKQTGAIIEKGGRVQSEAKQFFSNSESFNYKRI